MNNLLQAFTNEQLKTEVPVVNVGDTILAVDPTSGETATDLIFVAPASHTYAGRYTGSVTFTVVVE